MATTNEAQRDYWNGSSGQNWVTHQNELDALMAPLAALLIAAAGPRPGEKVLDLGCGAGATCLLAGPKVAPAGEVLGIDISAPLVALARERVAAAGLGHVAVEVADAQTMPEPGRRFDLAISRFGVMFFEDPVAAFANIAGLLAPGARLVFASWAAVEHNPWFRLPMQAAVERLGPAAPADPDAPGAFAFRDRGRVEGTLQAAGFGTIGSREVDVELPVEGGADAATRFARHVGPIARHLQDKGGDADDLAAILGTLRAAFAPFETEAGLRIPARVNLFEARVG